MDEVLKYIAGIDLSSRGAFGVQSDVYMRGSTLEQVLVMIDGVPVNNPQTGHFNLNLPVVIDDIEKIEILKGSSSKTHGSSAFAGVINIITKSSGENNARFETVLGGHGLEGYGGSFSFSLGKTQNRISVETKSSDGYIENTDFETIIGSFKTSIPLSSGDVNLFCAYQDKKFGANGFYTDRFPLQWEHTRNLIISGGGSILFRNFLLTPKIYLIAGEDTFLLDRTDPEFYRNNHTTGSIGAEIRGVFDTGIGSTSFAMTYRRDDLESNSLGTRDRTTAGLHIEQRMKIGNSLALSGGLSLNSFSDDRWYISPGLDIGYTLSGEIIIFISANKAVRLPTFTDLYYSSPANQGNENLLPEEAWTLEMGGRLMFESLSLRFSVSSRLGENIIDWVRYPEEMVWKAENIESFDVSTAEAEIRYYFPSFTRPLFETITAAYSYSTSDSDIVDGESKYLFNFLKHHFLISCAGSILHELKWNLNFAYKDRFHQEPFLVLDGKLSGEFGEFTISAEVRNLFNVDYYDAGFLKMPGRWVLMSMSVNLPW